MAGDRGEFQTDLFSEANLERTAASLALPKAVPALAVSALAEAAKPVVSLGVIKDAGAELVFNRRNRTRAAYQWEDVASLNDTLKAKEVVKSNIWLKPDYAQLIEGGMPALAAHVVKQIYDSVAVKPTAGRSGVDDALLQLYMAGVKRVEAGVMAWANDRDALRVFVNANVRSGAAMLGAVTPLTALIPSRTKSLLEFVYPGGWRNFEAEVRACGANKVLAALQPGFEDAGRALKAIKAGWPAKREAWEVQGFKVVEHPDVSAEKLTYRQPVVYMLFVDGKPVRSFETEIEAEAGKASIKPFALFGKRGYLDSFESEELAVESAKERTRKDKGQVVGELGARVESIDRVGVARRMEGEDVSSERLMEEFGLKGVNFGNWMKTPSARAEAQLHLNHAFDSFHDLAEIMGVPPKAISLNGMLGLAIGAQGSGGSRAAHFVPGVNEINLTRTSGAGSVAHEWAHALDHYFAVQAGLASAAEPFLSEQAALGATRSESRRVDGVWTVVETPRFVGIRPEMVGSFSLIVDAMNKRLETQEDIQAKDAAYAAKANKNVAGWLLNFRRDYRGHEVEFDLIAERIKAGNIGDGHVMVGRTAYLSPALIELRDLYKSKTGRVYSIDNLKNLQSWVESAKREAGKAGLSELRAAGQVRSNYAAAAAKLDEEKGGKPYWGTTLEKFARAFDGFVSDQLVERQAQNGYLSHTGLAGDTVPNGEERVTVNAAFKALVGEVKVRDAERGPVLFSAGEDVIERVDQTQTAEFKKWFGESKAVDGEGRPLRVYHGTARTGISVFKGYRGSAGHFAFDLDIANHWADQRYSDAQDNGTDDEYGDGALVYPAYLRANNIFDARDQHHVNVLNENLGRAGRKLPEHLTWDFNSLEQYLSDIKAAGFDSYYDFENGIPTDKVPTGIAVFDSAQIKSAIGNNGKFDGTNPDILFSQNRTWRSALRDSVEAANANSAPAQGWLEAIKGLVNKGGVKADEVEWSGLTDWLTLQGEIGGQSFEADLVADGRMLSPAEKRRIAENPGKVSIKITKDQILGYLDANGVQVEETVLGFRASQATRAALERAFVNSLEKIGFSEGDASIEMRRMKDDRLRPVPKFVDRDVLAAATELHANMNNGNTDSSKYEQYTLPGGENYREVLLTLPERAATDFTPFDEWASRQNSNGKSDSMAAYKQAKGKFFSQSHKENDYQSRHWDQKNVLAHIRVNDRTDADGKRVLFVEEIQSDWGQEGKKKGFRSEETPLLTNAEERRFQDLREEGRQNLSGSELAEFDDLINRRDAPIENKTRPPSAPFVTNTDKWLALALKRIIKMAVDGGYDKVAFVSGEQSADRYDLSKQISVARAVEDGIGKWHLSADKLDGKTALNEREIPTAEVADYFGKDVAEKLLSASPDQFGAREVSGVGLSIGGEGMKAFYSQIVPSVANALLKKLGGGRMEDVMLEDHASPAVKSMSPENRARFGLDTKGLQQSGFTITPKMRELAAQGLPMFSAEVGAKPVTLPMAEITIEIQRLRGQWKSMPSVTVVESAKDLPFPSPAHADGAYCDGRVYVVASNIRNLMQLQKVMAHECVMHHGLEEMLGPYGFSKLHQGIQKLKLDGDPVVTALAANILSRYGELPPEIETREIVARAGEQCLDESGNVKVSLGFMKGVFAGITGWLRDHGISVPFTNTELQGIMHNAGEWVKLDGPGRAPVYPNSMTNGLVLNSFGGVRAITAPLDTLNVAREMLLQGEEDHDIWDQTGWTFAFPDGQPRFEISDDKANILVEHRTMNEVWEDMMNLDHGVGNIGEFIVKYPNHSLTAEVNNPAFGRPVYQGMNSLTSASARGIENYLAHHDLYAAYPELAKITAAKLIDADGTRSDGAAAFVPSKNRMEFSKIKNPDEFKVVALHEFQHAIQRVEGFSLGGDPKQFGFLDVTDRELGAISEKVQGLFEQNPAFYRDVVKANQASLAITEKYGDLMSGFDDEPLAEAWREAVDCRNAHPENNEFFKLKTLERQITKSRIVLSPVEQYTRLAGEAEARLTQIRSDMTPEERRAEHPLNNFDVPVEAQALRFDSRIETSKLVQDGFHVGKVLDVVDGMVLQRTGRDGAVVRHAANSLAGSDVRIGDVIEVTYKGSVGQVKTVGQGVGCER